MEWQYHFRDNYVFDPKSKASGGATTDENMADLNAWGVAHDFPVFGVDNINVTWTKGERIGKELQLDFPSPENNSAQDGKSSGRGR